METKSRPSRVALYSHDTYGLGHLRRSLILANALQKEDPSVEVLLITGSPRAFFFERPASTRMVKLPAVTKDESGQYISRQLNVPLEETIRVRKRAIRQAVLDFRPDLFVVDHAPLGLRGELLPLLGDLRHRSDTEIVLGLRDILDDPSDVIDNWQDSGVYRVLESIYHHIWVYGDRRIFAVDELYGMSREVAQRLVYLGYLGRENGHLQSRPSLSAGFPDPARPHLLGLLGGGGDGFPLAKAFLQMMELQPDRWNGTLVTGPFLSRNKRNRLESRAARLPHVHLLRFTSSMERMLVRSDAVLTMGGYNAMMEAVSLHLPTLVVPRVFPRREQWLRAHAFQKLGLVSALDPEGLCAQSLLDRTASLLDAGRPPTPQEQGIVWNGAQRFAKLAHQLLSYRTTTKRASNHAPERLLRA